MVVPIVRIDLVLLLSMLAAAAALGLLLGWRWGRKRGASSGNNAYKSGNGQRELFGLLSRYDHNLDTYLTTLRGCMSTLKRTVEQSRPQLEIWEPLWREAFASINSMGHFVHQMRLVRYGYQPNNQVKTFVPLHTTLNSVLGSFLEAAEARDIEIKHDIDKRVQVSGSTETLTEIFNTLVDNAIKHSNGTEMVVELVPEEDTVLIRISDNGPLGIPSELQGRIFEEGVRDRTAGSSQGSGMGLATARILTQQLGGTIALNTSVPGKTVFEVRLPQAMGPDKTDGVPS